ncbi:MAG: sigma-70 family RNA polymerase sigma factor [Deltaproteobacteria bacterium]|nr:sigma-70 family RNA polymerase sigma factor [Deltaproteobacteria bacterium]
MPTGPNQQETPSEAALLRSIQLRDRAAFEELYTLYYRRLYGYLIRQLLPSDLIEEVINDVMYVVWKDAEKFQGRSRVSTWIFGIAYFSALKRLRKDPREQEVSDQEIANREAEDPGRDIWRRELRLALLKALRALSPEHRAVVELTYFQDCSYREISEIVGCPVNTVKTRMFHARLRLRDILRNLGIREGSWQREGASG